MQISICTGFDYTIPFAQVIPMIKRAGFDTVSLGAIANHSGYITTEGRALIRKLIDENDLIVDSVHAPCPEGDRLFSLDEDERLEGIHLCQVAIDASAELESRIVVLHLLLPYDIPHGQDRDRMIEQGHRSIETLLVYAKHQDVKLALENGQRADYDQVLADLLNEFDDDYVGFCYDSGHEHVQGTCFKMLERFGHRLLTLHLHDNAGRDTHILPYEGTIPWDQFCTILHGLNYSGNLQLETDILHSQFDDPVLFLNKARECAEMLLHKSSLDR